MKHDEPHVYGIGNPLIDIIVQVGEDDLEKMHIHKGTMHLIDEQRREALLAYIKDRPVDYSCGGSCPNTIITLASLGIRTTLAGKVGLDTYGKLYRQRLHQFSVADELVECDEPTGSSIIFITSDSERTMNTYLGANRYFGPNDVVQQTIREADIFHFTGYMWDTQSQKDSVKLAITIAEESNTRISFDVADSFAVGRNRDEFLSIIADHATVVFANSEEARILFDNYDPYECCKSMGKLCETAVVKNGKAGSFICHRRTIFRIPSQGPEVPVDTTGAGDVYAAGFLYGLCRNLSIMDAGSIASFLAGEIIQQRGAQFPPAKARTLRRVIEQTYL